MYYLGVDCGGTKSLFLVSDENGGVLATYLTGSGGFFLHGQEGIRRLVEEGAKAVCGRAGIAVKQLERAGLGFPGYGEMEGSERMIQEACDAALGPGKAVCACDCALGWAGSLAMEPGVNIVAGTGSICYGVNARGEAARAGGWGTVGDEGSCRWIGTRLLQLYTKQADGRLPKTRLYEAFRARFGITDDTLFIYPMNQELMHSATELAKLQLLARALYDEEDPWARAVYQEAARELALTAHAVAKKLGLTAGYAVSYSGGLFRSGGAVTGPLAREVGVFGGRLCAPRYTPEQGAVLMAMRAREPGRSFGNLRFTARAAEGAPV